MYKIILLQIVFVLFIAGCSNDMKEVEKVSAHEEYPDIAGEKIDLFYSDSGRITVTMKAPEVVRYANVEEPYTEFPKGLYVVYYSMYPDTASMIRADYAKKFEKERKWEAKGNVVTKNVKGEKLETEFLIWDELKEKIYSEEKVTISTGDDVIWGEGFEADQDFTNWSIKKLVGELSIQTGFDDDSVETIEK